MELRHLRYFVHVADELHFGRAADRLGMSQPPLSQSIRALEAEIGVPLFERTSRRVRLTEAGRLFLAEARDTLAHAESAVATARRAAAGELGRLAIGFSPSSIFAPPVSATLTAFRQRHPEVRLDLSEQTLAMQRDAFSRGVLDIGLTRRARRPALPPGIVARALLEDGMHVALPADHPLARQEGPVALRDIATEPLVHYPYDRGGFLDDLHQLYEQAGHAPRVVQEARELSTLLGLVAAGMGISIVAGSIRRLGVDTLRYRPLADPEARSTIWLVTHEGHPRPAAAAFVALLEEMMRGEAPDAQ